MSYNELTQLFFERSNALQEYWNLYVVVIGGLLGLSTLRHQRDLIKTILITVLFACFAYKNLDAIHDVTLQRFAALKLVTEYQPAPESNVGQVRQVLEPTLGRATLDFESVRNFHVFCDLLTIAAVWAMEWRR